MRKRTRVILAVAVGLILLVMAGMFALYTATQHVPEAYTQAMRVDPIKQEKDSDEMLRQASALTGELQKEGRWQVLFTAEQINGWLAVDMVENHPELVSPEFADPRVAITPQSVTIFGRITRGGQESVASLVIEPYLSENNELGLRIRDIRAGSVPLPLGRVLDTMSTSAGNAGYQMRWLKADGDPVSLITIPELSDGGRIITVDTLRLGDGEVFLSGETE